MRIPALVVFLLSACATADSDSLVDNPVYEAWGARGWQVVIGDDIALRLGHDFFPDPIVSAVYLYPYRPARAYAVGRRWRSRRGASFITIDALPGPCRPGDGSVYEQNVRVVTHRHDLRGCGGRLIREANDWVGAALTGPARARIRMKA
jgi:hypothetical protein